MVFTFSDPVNTVLQIHWTFCVTVLHTLSLLHCSLLPGAVLDSSSPQWNSGLRHSGKLFQCSTWWHQLCTRHVTDTLNLGRMLLQVLLCSSRGTGQQHRMNRMGSRKWKIYTVSFNFIQNFASLRNGSRFDSVAKKSFSLSILFLPARFSDYF